jgi:hypothetical protein
VANKSILINDKRENIYEKKRENMCESFQWNFSKFEREETDKLGKKDIWRNKNYVLL